MNYTQNHHLPQWEGSDRVLRTDFNDAMSSIDTALTGCGNCKIVFGTYVGDGNYDHSPTLEFNSAPVALFLLGGGYSVWMLRGAGTWSFAHSRGSSMPIGATWEGNSVYWYYDGIEHTAKQFLNEADTTYRYLALLES